jgi:DNA-directed RNA polymerase subunit K/omega
MKMKKIELSEDEHTKYEKTRIIGSRALQISMGAPILVKLSQKDLEDISFNPIEIAKKEYAAGVIPMKVKRLPPQGRMRTEMRKSTD